MRTHLTTWPIMKNGGKRNHQVVSIAPDYLVALGIAPAVRVVSEHNTQAEAEIACDAEIERIAKQS